MEFYRWLILFFLLSPLSYASPTLPANQGIAFIHGTKDHRQDAYGGYWQKSFIKKVAQGLANPDNFFVVHCDFNQYMWHEDAGNCVAEQLVDFIDKNHLDSLTIYTHSNGANVIRWIISHPVYDKQYLLLKQKIRQVIAIAPSSGGTILADEVINGGVFETSLSWLLGYSTDAVKQQRVGDMHIYNDELLLGSTARPSLPVPFKVIVGTDVKASPLSSASYCNGFFLNSGLKISQLYLDKCSDGFINCSSQIAAGDVWFHDIEKQTISSL